MSADLGNSPERVKPRPTPAAGVPAAAGGASAQPVLMRGNDTDRATLDHHRTLTVAEGNAIRDLCEGLVAEAERWDVSEDGADLHVPPARRVACPISSSATISRWCGPRGLYPGTGGGFVGQGPTEVFDRPREAYRRLLMVAALDTARYRREVPA